MGIISSISGLMKTITPKIGKVECSGHYSQLCDACKDCTPNYNADHFPNNYDCGHFRPYVKEQKIVVNK